jgi:hypothetical protein
VVLTRATGCLSQTIGWDTLQRITESDSFDTTLLAALHLHFSNIGFYTLIFKRRLSLCALISVSVFGVRYTERLAPIKEHSWVMTLFSP